MILKQPHRVDRRPQGHNLINLIEEWLSSQQRHVLLELPRDEIVHLLRFIVDSINAKPQSVAEQHFDRRPYPFKDLIEVLIALIDSQRGLVEVSCSLIKHGEFNKGIKLEKLQEEVSVIRSCVERVDRNAALANRIGFTIQLCDLLISGLREVHDKDLPERWEGDAELS